MKKRKMVMKENNALREWEEKVSLITYVIEEIDRLCLDTHNKLKNGKRQETEVLISMANAMESVDVMRGTDKWKLFYSNMKQDVISEDFCDKLVEWQNEVYDWINVEDSRYCTCNICGKRVVYQKMSDYFRNEQRKNGFRYWNTVFESISRKNRECPECHSMDRERMIALFLDMLKSETGDKIKVLQIAPSYAMDLWLKSKDDIEYETTDLYMEGVSFQSDIQNMYMVKDETYDVVICSHILEHVEDDRKAMKELKRILKREGICLFLVPLIIGLDKTDEEFGRPAEENWRRFGQDDHARLYAKEDFLNRLTKEGYLVHILDKHYFGDYAWKKAGLSDIHCLYVATKQDIGIGVTPYKKKEVSESLVSVIIPSYNRGYCIEKSVQSVLNQTYKNIEVIVVDDGSTDETDEVIAGINDSRIRYIKTEENKGANHARNLGIQAALGEYIAFNDSDDEWIPEKLTKQMKLMNLLEGQGDEYGCVYCSVTRYEDGRIVQIAPDMEVIGEEAVGDIYHYMLTHMFISTQSLLLKKKVIEEVGGFNENLKRLQDWELLLRIAQKYKFSLVQESLVNAYTQKESISKNTDAFIDTVLYVSRYHNVVQIDKNMYYGLMNMIIKFAISEGATEECILNMISQMKEDKVFKESEIEEISRKLRKNESDEKNSLQEEKLNLIIQKMNQMEKKLDEVQKNVTNNDRMLNEILWAQVFNSSKSACKWLDSELALWPGRWAVGYQYMYVISRYLNEVQPKNILETGLGQSTRLIGSYVKWKEKIQPCNHLVIEHDADWIDIFKKDFGIGDSTQIVQRNLTSIQFVGKNQAGVSVCVYQDLQDIFKGRKFEFISLDGPYGTNDRNGYSRIDIINYLPECLAESFCIVLDDYERWGEKNTVECIKVLLKENDIAFCEVVYRGMQDVYMLVSPDLQYLCTL